MLLLLTSFTPYEQVDVEKEDDEDEKCECAHAVATAVIHDEFVLVVAQQLVNLEIRLADARSICQLVLRTDLSEDGISLQWAVIDVAIDRKRRVHLNTNYVCIFAI